MADKRKQQLAKAFDATSTAGKLIDLNEEQISAFVDYVVDESTILKQCRVEKRSAPNGYIPYIETSDGYFLKP